MFSVIKIMFYKHRSSRSNLLCKNDVFKRVKMFLKVLQNSRESICVRVSFWKNRLIKKPSTQVFSCEFCKTFKITYFQEWLTANGCLLICFMKRVIVFLDPRPLVLGPHLVGPQPQKYCTTKYNTIIWFLGSYHLKTLK